MSDPYRGRQDQAAKSSGTSRHCAGTRGNSDVLICRCEEVTEAQVLAAIEMGARTLWQVRRRTRLGMGLCQGRSCQRLVARILADALGVPIEQVLMPSYRPPVQPVPLETLCSGEYLDLENL